MLITLSRRTAICQSVVEVWLTGVVPLGAVSDRFFYFIILCSHKIGKDINSLCRRCLNGNETVELLLCECESLTMSRGRIFGQSFRELQQLSHVPVDLFRQYATKIRPAGK